MMTHFATKLGLSVVALGLAVAPAMAQTAAPTPAPAAAPMPAPMHPPMHKPHNPAAHAAIHAKKGTKAHDTMADQLNAKSLDAAQSGQAFMPPGAAAPAQADPMMKKKM